MDFCIYLVTLLPNVTSLAQLQTGLFGFFSVLVRARKMLSVVFKKCCAIDLVVVCKYVISTYLRFTTNIVWLEIFSRTLPELWAAKLTSMSFGVIRFYVISCEFSREILYVMHSITLLTEPFCFLLAFEGSRMWIMAKVNGFFCIL